MISGPDGRHLLPERLRDPLPVPDHARPALRQPLRHLPPDLRLPFQPAVHSPHLPRHLPPESSHWPPPRPEAARLHLEPYLRHLLLEQRPERHLPPHPQQRQLPELRPPERPASHTSCCPACGHSVRLDAS